MKLTLGTDLNTTLTNAAVSFSRESQKWTNAAQEAVAEQEAFGPRYGMMPGTSHDVMKASRAIRTATVYANAAKHAVNGILFLDLDAMNTSCYMEAIRGVLGQCYAQGRVIHTENDIIAEEMVWAADE